MSLNLDDNKRPYSPNLGLNDVFDEIQASVNALETAVSNIPTAKKYVAYITQSGTASPVLTEYENTTGLTFIPAWTGETGEYYVNISGGTLTANKSIIKLSGNNDATYRFTVAWNRSANATGFAIYTLGGSPGEVANTWDDGLTYQNSIL